MSKNLRNLRRDKIVDSSDLANTPFFFRGVSMMPTSIAPRDSGALASDHPLCVLMRLLHLLHLRPPSAAHVNRVSGSIEHGLRDPHGTTLHLSDAWLNGRPYL